MAPLISRSLDVSNGMVDKVEPWAIGEKTAAYLQNLDISRPGSRKRRLGVQDLGGRADLPGGMWHDKDSTYDGEVLFGIFGGSVYRMPGGGRVFQQASGVSLTDNLHAGHLGIKSTTRCVYVTQAQQDDSTVTLASKVIRILNITDYSQCASMAPLCATWWEKRLWCAGNVLSQTPETLWWSELGDGLSYSLTNSIEVEHGLGGRITGLAPFRGDVPQLVIFKENAICLFTPLWGSNAQIPGAADALDTIHSNLTVISSNMGCVASRSIQYLPGFPGGDLIFLARDGFRLISRTVQDAVSGVSLPISDPIRETIRRINMSYAHKAVSTVFESTYYCAVPLDGATKNTHVIALSWVTGTPAWSVDTWAARDLHVALTDQTRDNLYMQYANSTADCSVTGAQTGYHVYRNFTNFFDPGGVAIQFREDSRGFLPTGDLHEKFTWDRVGLAVLNEAGATTALSILYNIDRGGWVTAGSLAFDAVSASVILGQTPLPWGANVTQLTTKYLSLADAPPGFEIQIRYVSEDANSLPSVVSLSVWANRIGPENDNSLN